MENSDINTINNSAGNTDEEKVMSKNQMKKLARRQKWLLQKSERRAKEREVEKKKRREAKEKGIDLGPSRKALKKAKMSDSSCKVNVVIDLSLSHLMTDQETSKLAKQMQRCYAINRRATNPVQFHITSLKGKIKDKMEIAQGYQNWDVNIQEESFTDVFENSNIIYLSSDSENLVDKLDDGKAYIIGGLVDHNRLKRVCYERSKEKNISHARLPIAENIALRTSAVLTVDQVFTILLKVTSGKSWKDALLEVIPQRKQIAMSENESSEEDGNKIKQENTEDKNDTEQPS